MRITEINMPAEADSSDGLKSIQMKRIGSVVVLAGKNGSGKTRLLRRIFNWVRSPESKTDITPVLGEIQRRKTQIQGLFPPNLGHNKQAAEVFQRQINDYNLILDKHSWISASGVPPPEIIYFVPKPVILNDPESMSRSGLRESAKAVSTKGVDPLANSLAKIQYLQDKAWEATHQHSTLPRQEKDLAVQEYEVLKQLLWKFLGTDVTRSNDGVAELFALRAGSASLSEGQRILLQFCVGIYAQGADLPRLIVLMDEPENHLHPSAMLEAIEAIRKHLTDGQLWIATHSIPLLAAFDPSSIWWMEHGVVSYGGNIPRKVLEGLLGNEEGILKLSDFLNFPFELASSRFASQSLFAPEVVMTGADDKQTIQVVDILKRFERSDKVRILDFGAGKGRLASVIYDSLDKTTLSDWLDYIAFDTNTDTKVECESAIARIYGSADKRYFNTNQDLFSNFDNASFDAVVMCNVLHEIDPKDWLTLFAPSGPIAKLLKEGGVLLLVEDNQMPVGEKPHQKGFVVLDTAELKALFAIREGDLKFKVYPDRNGRLKAHEIPRECLARVTADTRKAAMLMLFHVAKENIKALRKVAGTYQNGRLHGFWVQQFANASLVLDENKPQ